MRGVFLPDTIIIELSTINFYMVPIDFQLDFNSILSRTTFSVYTIIIFYCYHSNLSFNLFSVE